MEPIMVNKETFCAKLKFQITSGRLLSEKKISSESDFLSLDNDSKLWSDYNLELLNCYFNNYSNEYSNGYKNILIMGYLGNHTLEDKVKSCKNKLQKRIQFLESLINRIDLL